MAPDMLLGMDKARGESKTVFCVIDKESGKLTPLHFSDKPLFTIEEIKGYGERLKKMSVSWTAEFKPTHKEARFLKKHRREFFGKKTRIPRKRKKALKNRIVQKSPYKARVLITLEWPNAQPLIDFYEKKLFEAASVKLQEDIYRHMGALGNTIKEIINPLH